MFWVIIAILAIIVGLLEDLAPFILILVIAAIVYFCYQSIKAKLEARELDRKLRVAQSIADFVKENSPKASAMLQTPERVVVECESINKDVVSIVKKYQDLIREYVTSKNACDAQLKRYLKLDEHIDVDEKRAYFDTHEKVIRELKDNSDELYSKIYQKKIQLFANTNQLSGLLRDAIMTIGESKKCSCEKLDISKLITEEDPLELNMFQYKYKPTIMYLDGFSYCVFDNVILVFDRNGSFSTAIDPSALKITVKRKHSEHKWHEHIDEDSRPIKFKQSRGQWSYDVSGYEYGVITLSIGKKQISITVSSSKALDVCESVATKFHKKLNTKHDPIPNFLDLVYNLYKNSVVENITYRYETTTQYRNNFCGIANYDE